eukprot:scaffold54358_cov36-Cyclotella_meneghiniana.AAC.2
MVQLGDCYYWQICGILQWAYARPLRGPLSILLYMKWNSFPNGPTECLFGNDTSTMVSAFGSTTATQWRISVFEKSLKQM